MLRSALALIRDPEIPPLASPTREGGLRNPGLFRNFRARPFSVAYSIFSLPGRDKRCRHRVAHRRDRGGAQPPKLLFGYFSCLFTPSSGIPFTRPRRAHFDPPLFSFFEPDFARSTIFRTASGLFPTTTAMSAFPNPALERMISVGSLESCPWGSLSAAMRPKSASRAGSVGLGSLLIRLDPAILYSRERASPRRQEDHGHRASEARADSAFALAARFGEPALKVPRSDPLSRSPIEDRSGKSIRTEMLPAGVKLRRQRELQDLRDAVESRNHLVLKRAFVLHRQGSINPVVR